MGKRRVLHMKKTGTIYGGARVEALCGRLRSPRKGALTEALFEVTCFFCLSWIASHSISKEDEAILMNLCEAAEKRTVAEFGPMEDECWIDGPDQDQGEGYCRDCAEKEVARLSKENPESEFSVDGGWGSENDSTPFCTLCEKRLITHWTDEGWREEIRHFRINPPSLESDDDLIAIGELVFLRGFNWNQFDDWDRQLHAICKSLLKNYKRSKVSLGASIDG